MTDITIILRDINGRVYSYNFDWGGTALDFLVCELEDINTDELEILFVKHDGCCVYSALGNTNAIDVEDLIAYLV